MAFSFAGGQQTPFSPSSSPNWGFQATQPSFGAQPGSSPFRFSTGGSVFQSPTPFGAPSSGGSGFGGGSLFGAQSSGGLFAQAQSSPSQFPTPQFQTSPFGFQTAAPQWNVPQQPHYPPQPQNAFRDDFYRVVARKDKRPVTIYTQLSELEDTGQQAIRMIQEEQRKYKSICDEIFKEPWFQRDSKTETFEQAFEKDLLNLRKSMSEHGMDVEAFGRDLRKAEPRSEHIDQALRDADHIISEFDKLNNPQNGHGRLYSSELQYQGEFEVPHPFIVLRAMELRSRLETLLHQVKDMENVQKSDTEKRSNAEGQIDEFAAFELIHKLSYKMQKAMEKISEKVDMQKELFLTTHYRRHGDASDPFAEAAEEDRIREAEAHYELQEKRPVVLQPTMVQGMLQGAVQPNPVHTFAPPASTPLLGFSAPSASAFTPQASSGGPFGAATSQPTLFGQTTTSTAFPPTSGIFGTTSQPPSGFGAFASTTGGASPQFGKSGFGNNAGAFSSPGSSVATSFGASSFNGSPSTGRFGFKNNVNRSL